MPRAASHQQALHRWLELLSPVDRRVMAQLWGADNPEPSTLAAVMRDPQRVQSMYERLSIREREALERVLQDGGTIAVAVMQRRYGTVREPKGFAHPRAYLEALRGPATPTEKLFNLGFLFHAHDQRGAIYRVPYDLLVLLPDVAPRDRRLQVVPVATFVQPDPADAATAEDAVLALLSMAYHGKLASLDDGALNKASLVKLARELGRSPELRTIRREADWPLAAIARVMAFEAGLLRHTTNERNSKELRPTSQALEWLQSPRAQRARRLLDAWCASSLDDLTILCGLRWKGGAPYTLNRSATRRGLLQLLATLPANTWLDIDAITDEIYRVEPDFQRRDGRYDTWLLYNDRDHLVSTWPDWRLVEGALVQAVVSCPLRWLGLVELGNKGQAVRITPLGAHLLANAPAPSEPYSAPLIVQSTFDVLCPADASPYVLFQLQRFAERKQNGLVTIYTLNRASMLAAIERGISGQDALRFLQEHSAGPLPPAIMYSLGEWTGQAGQVRLEQAVLLQAVDPIVLARVRANRELGLGAVEPLSPTLLRVPDEATDQIADRLRKAGFGIRDERIDPQLPLDEHDLKILVTAAFAYARVCAELDLPCDLSPAMLQRLTKLVPARWADTARESAASFSEQISSIIRKSS